MSHSIIGVADGGGGGDGGAKKQNDSDCYRGWLDQHSNSVTEQNIQRLFCLPSLPCFTSINYFKMIRYSRILETAVACWMLPNIKLRVTHDSILLKWLVLGIRTAPARL